jgi:hypothetical protein
MAKLVSKLGEDGKIAIRCLLSCMQALMCA